MRVTKTTTTTTTSTTTTTTTSTTTTTKPLGSSLKDESERLRLHLLTVMAPLEHPWANNRNTAVGCRMELTLAFGAHLALVHSCVGS